MFAHGKGFTTVSLSDSLIVGTPECCGATPYSRGKNIENSMSAISIGNPYIDSQGKSPKLSHSKFLIFCIAAIRNRQSEIGNRQSVI